MKKKFVKKWESNQSSSNPTQSHIPNIFNDHDLKAVQDVNDQLRETLRFLIAENATSKDIIAIENKKLKEALEKELENAKVLKNVIYTQNSELSKNKHVIDCANKIEKDVNKSPSETINACPATVDNVSEPLMIKRRRK